LRFRGGIRLDPLIPEEVEQLVGYFSECLLCEQHRIMHELSVRHELHNVSIHILLVLHAVKRVIISIKDIHLREISTANTHNNDAQRQTAAPHDLINRLLEVINDTISNDQ